jgi:hypothetical protein
MPPLLHSEPRRDNPAVMAWASQEGPFSTQTLSHQPIQIQRSMSQLQRKPDLEQVVESDLTDVGEDPSDYIFRTIGTPTVSVSPSLPIPSTNMLNTYQYIPAPSTPTSDSLTTATTLTSNMSRQNSLNEYMLESMHLMKCSSNTSYSQDISHDQTIYDQVPPFPSSRHSRRSSNEEQTQLLIGAGGVSHESQFSHSLQFPSSGLSSEKMEKSQSNESTSSLSSTSSSRNVQRLQAQINLANARPLMPKGGSEDTIMSRENSSQSMNRLESKDGSSDKVAISSKPTYTRPKHDRVYCKQCDSHQEGFRGEHELRRHQDREHKPLVKKWVCIAPTDGSSSHPEPVLPLTRCKACHQQRKKYGAYYNAAAHLRRAHFKPKSKSARTKSNSKVEDGEKRGGKGGGDWPPMSELKYWMKEVEEQVTDCTLADDEQLEAADASDDDTLDNSFDESMYSQQPTSTMSGSGNFENNYTDASPMLHIYPQAVNINSNMYGMQNMPLDLTGASQQSPCMDQSMYTPSSQNSFSNFSPHHIFQNDATMAFYDASPSSLLPQNFEDQVLLAGPDFVDSAFYQ